MNAHVILGGEDTYRARAKAHPIVVYRGLKAEWDLFDQGGQVLHIICPRCANYGLISQANKRFVINDDGRVTVLEPFRCDYCLARFRVTDGVMTDA